MKVPLGRGMLPQRKFVASPSRRYIRGHLMSVTIHVCLVTRTCSRLHVWSATCVVGYMCSGLHVWLVTCVLGYMCG